MQSCTVERTGDREMRYQAVLINGLVYQNGINSSKKPTAQTPITLYPALGQKSSVVTQLMRAFALRKNKQVSSSGGGRLKTF